jgi:translation initiation factor RLI1
MMDISYWKETWKKHSLSMVVFTTGSCPLLNVSYKPQKISPKSQGTVRQLLHDRIRDAYIHPQFVTDVMKPLTIESIIDQEVCI